MTIQEKYDIGFKTFEKLYNLPKVELMVLLKDVFSSNTRVTEFLNENPGITKTSFNDVPEKIKLSFYDSLTITPFGISFKPEHGSDQNLINFDKYFSV